MVLDDHVLDIKVHMYGMQSVSDKIYWYRKTTFNAFYDSKLVDYIHVEEGLLFQKMSKTKEHPC